MKLFSFGFRAIEFFLGLGMECWALPSGRVRVMVLRHSEIWGFRFRPYEALKLQQS